VTLSAKALSVRGCAFDLFFVFCMEHANGTDARLMCMFVCVRARDADVMMEGSESEGSSRFSYQLEIFSMFLDVGQVLHVMVNAR
jgi:hypothetical protein